MDGTTTLGQRLLVRIAQQLGPELDRIDVAAEPSSVDVRDLLVEFTADGVRRPVDVRVALMDLIELGHLTGSGGELRGPRERVWLSMRGLLAAREIQPDCAVPARAVVLHMGGGGLFSARVATGSSSDAELARNGLALAAFYVLAVKRPTGARPLLLADCPPWFGRLAALGAAARRGGRDRLLPAFESIAGAIRLVGEHVLPLVEVDDDGRATGWYLRGEFPEVRIESASPTQPTDWTWMQFALASAIAGTPFLDAAGGEVRPLSDDQVRELRANRIAEVQRRRDTARELRRRAEELLRAEEDAGTQGDGDGKDHGDDHDDRDGAS